MKRLTTLVLERMPADFDVRGVDQDLLEDVMESASRLRGAKREYEVSGNTLRESFVVPIDPDVLASVPLEPNDSFGERVSEALSERQYLHMQVHENTKKISLTQFCADYLNAEIRNPRFSWVATTKGAPGENDVIYFFAWSDSETYPHRGSVYLFSADPKVASNGRVHPAHAEAIDAVRQVAEGRAEGRIAWKVRVAGTNGKSTFRGFNTLYVSDCRPFLDRNTQQWRAELRGNHYLKEVNPSG